MSYPRESPFYGQDGPLSEIPSSNRKRARSEDNVESCFSGSAKQQRIAIDNTGYSHSAISNNAFGPGTRIHQGNVINNAGNSSLDASAQDCRRDLFLTDPSEDRKALKRKKGDRARGTCEWILGTEELSAWLGSGQTAYSESQTSNLLWLHGNPGTGKSTMAIFLTEEPSRVFSAADGKTLAYFFCDSSFDKRKTATSVLRGLLYQLIQQHWQLLDYLLPKYNERGAELFKSFDALWAIFIAAAADQNTGQKYCIIDALDECDLESQTILLQQFQETFQSQDAPSNIRILVTSRPYSEICEYLKEFMNKDLTSFPQAKQDIGRCIEERVADLVKKKNYTDKVKQQVSDILREKAEGTFLWIGLACKELVDVPSKDAIQTLQNMPKGLHSLYKKLLDTALELEKTRADIIRRILSLVAVCVRPLSVLELSEACELYQEEVDIDTRIQFTRDQIASCRLMIIIQDEKVLLLHQSVKDYLVGANSSYFINEPEAHADIAYRCVNVLIEQFHSREQPHIHFLSYATTDWANHARMAQSRFEVRDSEAEFFRVNSPSREHWIETLRSKDNRYFYKIPQQFSILHIAGRWGIASLVDYIANQEFQDSNTKKRTSFINFDCVDNSNTTPIEQAVIWGHISVICKLLCLGAKVNELVAIAAATNSEKGKEVMELLLNRRGDQITITEEVIKAAAGNWQNGKEVITLLLNRRGSQITVTEEVVSIIAGGFDEKVMALLLDQRGDEITITEEVLKAAAGNSNGKEVMALLLDWRGDQIAITEEVLKAAAGNKKKGDEVMALLLDWQGDEITITEEVLEAAARNEKNGKEVMALLLDWQGDEITITEEVLEAAARNEKNGKEVMALLLDRQGDEITITEEVLEAAAGNLYNGKEVMALLLDRQGDQITITEEVLEAAAGNEEKGDEVMALLLDWQGDEITITEEVLKAVAGSWYNSKEVMALLLDRQGDQITITEEVLKAVAGNWYNGKKVMALLLDRQGDEITITEEVLKAAAGNWHNGKKVIALFLDRQGDEITITEEVLKAAAGNWYNGKEVMALLLDRQGDEITITEEVLKAAAGNEEKGDEVMALLLDRQGDQIAITEEVVKAAAGNEEKGDEVMALLLDRRRNQIAITEEVVKAAATCGQDAVLNLLSQQNGLISDWDKWRCISKFYNAARAGDGHCVEQLIHQGINPDMKNIRGETPLWIAARNGYEAVVNVLAKRTDVDVNSMSISGRSPLFWASGRGYEQVVVILMEAGADPRYADEDGDTAVIMARQNGHERVAKILERVG